MRKLIPVEEAKSLFSEGREWGMWRWLSEKRRARRTADAAWQALEDYEKDARSSWSEDVSKAWREAEAQSAAESDGRAKRAYEKAKEAAADVDPEIKAAVHALKKADDEAYKARMDAEAQFDEADRRMSTSMACEGAQMALDAWTMREKVIRKVEALGKRRE
jgi:hypothetical protein